MFDMVIFLYSSLKNLKLNRLINIEYQNESKSVMKSYALFIHMDHRYAYISCLNYERKPKL